ncbi:MAG: hypothetical protein IT384_22600 [Deltaproteobacteria bacterium]|nr:hypothetical protein [Deltaproteobacteria bacterium]
MARVGPLPDPQQRLAQARQEITARANELLLPQSPELLARNQQLVQQSADTYDRLNQAYAQLKTDPDRMVELSIRETKLLALAKTNPELAAELAQNGTAMKSIMIAEQAGIDWDQLKSLIQIQGVQAVHSRNAQQVELLAASLASYESAQAILSLYDQTARSTPKHQRPQAAEPTTDPQKRWIQKIIDSVKAGLSGLSGLSGHSGHSERTQASGPSASAGSSASSVSSPVVTGEGERLRFVPLPGASELAEQSGMAKTSAVSALRYLDDLAKSHGSRSNVFSLYVPDRGYSDATLMWAVGDRLAELHHNLQPSELIGSKRASQEEAMRNFGLFPGQGPSVDQADRAHHKNPNGRLIKAVFDLSKRPPEIALARLGPREAAKKPPAQGSAASTPVTPEVSVPRATALDRSEAQRLWAERGGRAVLSPPPADAAVTHFVDANGQGVDAWRDSAGKVGFWIS